MARLLRDLRQVWDLHESRTMETSRHQTSARTLGPNIMHINRSAHAEEYRRYAQLNHGGAFPAFLDWEAEALMFEQQALETILRAQNHGVLEEQFARRFGTLEEKFLSFLAMLEERDACAGMEELYVRREPRDVIHRGAAVQMAGNLQQDYWFREVMQARAVMRRVGMIDRERRRGGGRRNPRQEAGDSLLARQMQQEFDRMHL